MEKEILKEKLKMLKEKLKTLKDLKFKNTAKITVGVTLVLFWSMLMYSYGMNNETNNCVNYENGYEDGYDVAYEKVNKDLTLLANRTNKYTSLTPEQTTIINKQIDELKQKEKDELEAAKKAEEEKKKQEEIAKKEEEERKRQEEIAKKEAEEQAKRKQEEAERIAQEQAKREQKEAERIAQEQANSSVYSTSASVNETVQSEDPGTQETYTVQETPTTRMVWISATGSKYHSKNDCGSMNPSNATQISLDDANARGMSPCSRCH